MVLLTQLSVPSKPYNIIGLWGFVMGYSVLLYCDASGYQHYIVRPSGCDSYVVVIIEHI